MLGLPKEKNPVPTDACVNRAMTAVEWVMLLALSVLWGGSFFFSA